MPSPDQARRSATRTDPQTSETMRKPSPASNHLSCCALDLPGGPEPDDEPAMLRANPGSRRRRVKERRHRAVPAIPRGFGMRTVAPSGAMRRSSEPRAGGPSPAGTRGRGRDAARPTSGPAAAREHHGDQGDRDKDPGGREHALGQEVERVERVTLDVAISAGETSTYRPRATKLAPRANRGAASRSGSWPRTMSREPTAALGTNATTETGLDRLRIRPPRRRWRARGAHASAPRPMRVGGCMASRFMTTSSPCRLAV